MGSQVVTTRRANVAAVGLCMLILTLATAASAWAASANLVKDINPDEFSFGSSPKGITEVAGIGYFSATDGTHGTEVWRTNGVAAGTRLVKDINTFGNSSPQWLANVGGTLFFEAFELDHGAELWKSNGTIAGTRLVRDIDPDSGQGSNPEQITDVNGTAYFRADDGQGYELWKSDGTGPGTLRVRNIFPGSTGSFPNQLTNVGGTLFFTADNGSHGIELWKSNGTTAGTQMVKNINTADGGARDSDPNDLTAFNGALYFSATDAAGGTELWRSDGTAAGTTRVRNIAPGIANSTPSELTVVGPWLLFSAAASGGDRELWRTDGTAAGTRRVADIFAGVPGSFPIQLANVGGMLFFSATEPDHGRELWRSNGTAAGTVLVRDIRGVDQFGANNDSNPAEITDVAGTAFFRADTDAGGIELWKSDGTFAGTGQVRDINPGAGDSFPLGLAAVNGMLLFNAFTPTIDEELWRGIP